MLDLADTFLRDAQLDAERFQRDGLVAEAALQDDMGLPRVQGLEGIGDPFLAARRIAIDHDLVFRNGGIVSDEILPFAVTIGDHGRVQRPVTGRKARGHGFNVADGHAQMFGNPGRVLFRHHAIAGVIDLGAEAAEIEEEGLLGRRCAGAHDGPVAQDIVLDRGADPPAGIGGEAHFAGGFEPGGGHHQADIAFGDEVGHGQAIMAKARGHGDDEAHIGGGEFVKGGFVLVVTPAAGEVQLVLLFQHGRLHGGAHKGPVGGSVGVVCAGHGSDTPEMIRTIPIYLCFTQRISDRISRGHDFRLTTDGAAA